MKYLKILGLILFLQFSAFSQTAVPEMKIAGFSHPESVIYDAARNVLYVSNMGNKIEGDGFISKVSPDGNLLEAKWISGLQDPKGLLLQGNRLFVTDKKELIEMDIEKGEIINRFRVTGAQSLNDITSDQAGNIYFSDLAGNSIFKRSTSGVISHWLHDEQLQRPNGLLVVDDNMYVSAWGKDSPGNLLKVDMTTKEIQVITDKGIGNLDGLQQKDANGFYVSDWAGGKVYRISATGEQEVVISAEKSVGDILFFEEEDQLILPMNLQNELWIYNLD